MLVSRRALASSRDCCRLVTADRKAQAVLRAIANVQSLEFWLLVALLPVFPSILVLLISEKYLMPLSPVSYCMPLCSLLAASPSSRAFLDFSPSRPRMDEPLQAAFPTNSCLILPYTTSLFGQKRRAEASHAASGSGGMRWKARV